MDTLWFALAMASSLIALSPLTLRWSRMLWLNFFVPFNPLKNQNT
jgi:hypothetical protein